MTTGTLKSNTQYALDAITRTRHKHGELRAVMHWLAANGRGSERMAAVVDTVPGHTAAWTYDAARGRHVVKLDRDFVESMEHNKASNRMRIAYARQLLRHEGAHVKYTTRDWPTIAAEAHAKGVPHFLVNLFEDVRIEAKARAEADAEPFGWTRFHATERTTDDPVRFVFEALTREHASLPHWVGVLRVCRVRGGVPEASSSPTRSVLVTFVAEATAAATTQDIVALCEDFLATFGGAVKDDGLPARRRGTGYSTPVAAPFEAAPAPTIYSGEYNPDAMPTGMPEDRLAELGHFVNHRSAPSEVLAGLYRQTERAEVGGRPLTVEAAPLANRLAQLLGAVDAPRTRTATSGATLHMPGAMVGDATSFRGRAVRGGLRKVVVVVDQSGSMGYDWRHGGAAFTAAMLMLHQRRALDVTVILSGGRASYVLPPTFNPRLLAGLHCNHGCESIDATLKRHKAVVAAADTVLIYTDGHLTDGRVTAGEWRSHGVDLVGCAVAHGTDRPKIQAALNGHFAYGITANSPNALATAIVQHVVAH